MHGIAVALLTEDREQLSALQSRLEATRLGRSVFSNLGFPVGPTDSILRQLQDSRAEVVIVDISPRDAQRAIRAIADHLADVIRKGQATGDVRPDVDPAAAAWLVLSLMSAQPFRAAAMPDNGNLEEGVTALLLRALEPTAAP